MGSPPLPILQHQHLIVRAQLMTPPKEPALLKVWLKELVKRMGMQLAPLPSNPNAYYCDMEGNRGITAVTIIETSHIALHVWDEDSPALAQLDIYTCSSLDVQDVLEHFEQFEPVEVEYKFLDRESGLVELDSRSISKAPVLA